MQNCTILSCRPGDIPAIVALQERYALACPGATIIPAEVYSAPAFAGGRNIACAHAPDGGLLGYASLYPAPAAADPRLPRVVWAEIRVDPALAEPGQVRNRLFDHIMARLQEISTETPGRASHLTFQYLPAEIESITYVTSQGATYTESIFRMRRVLSRPIPRASPPAGIRIGPWRMPDELDQVRYVQARNEAFPDEPVSLAEWQYFLGSPQWAAGTAIAAFSGEDLLGSVTVYWDEGDNNRNGRAVGYTEDIFVRPAWRGRGIARSLVRAAMVYLRKHDLADALLEVRAHNGEALRLYYSLGFDVAQETRLYALRSPQLQK